MKQPTLQEAIDRAKHEILEDVGAGVVPADVPDFSSLHDHVDANEYGGAAEGWYEGCCGNDAFVAFWNDVQEALDQWIKAGGRPRRRPSGRATSTCVDFTGRIAYETGAWAVIA